MTDLPPMSWKPLYPGHEPNALDPNSMVAKVASAIENCEGGYEDQARAAIEAMREPTAAMLKAANDLQGWGWGWEDQHEALINAALEGK